MTEETKQSSAATELDKKSKQQEKTSVESKGFKESPERFQSLEPQAVNGNAKFAEKEKDNTQQREAIIRPQKAGKIDFKSLQNHSFNRNRTWSGGKDAQSPSGKSRNRDRSRKSGKGERGNLQQLYRLSVTNPRSNPTIGIAYPQQKVSPVKKLESSQGPVSGSYRFQVSSFPERETQLQKEEQHFKCFQEDSSNSSSQSYTSKAGHHSPPSTPQQHKSSPIEDNSPPPGEENAFADLQLRETEPWQSLERTSQKPSFMPLSFECACPLIDESASDSVPCIHNTQSQLYTDIYFNTNHVSHNSFSFQSPVEGHVVMQASTQFVSDQVQDRQSYPSHAKPPQYMPAAHGVSPVPTNEKSFVSSAGQSEQSKSVPAKYEPCHAVGSKRGYHHKNGTASPNVFIQGSAHHFRNSHPWERPNKAFAPPLMEKTSTPHPYQCQPSTKHRQNTGINGHVPWQQIRFTAAFPTQNRIDISRQLINQKNFLIIPSALQDNSEPHINNLLSRKTAETFSNQKQDSPSHFANNVETNPDQLGNAKNNSVYFGINHSVPVTSSRNATYPALPVAPVGLKIASPYDSSSRSPAQNSASNSTCSSLSPASTSSLSSNPDDSQTSKVLPPQFYQQQQDKASTSSSNSQNHSEASRGLRSKQERAKENVLNFRDSKLNLENGQNCLDPYRTEQKPPPPYSTHQLLTTSLAAANLDQLDVVLTCKQCDQNFNNLVCFLDHKLYCGQHTLAQSDLKDLPKMEDGRKLQTGNTKVMPSESSYEILRSSSDLHLSLLGLNKNGEIMSDSETKGDIKNDPMKLMLPSAPLPDLEMEDPKLDSLITEALNGLGYQYDNAEIDSSFIDAFVDDDLSATKSTSTRQALNTKDPTAFEGKTNNELTPKVNDKYPFDSGSDSLTAKHTKTSLEERLQTVISPEEPMSEECSTQNEWKNSEQVNDCASKILLSSSFSAKSGLKSLKSMCPTSASVTTGSAAQKTLATEGKENKKTAGESWSKDLIHKIVQQKNKLQKLQVKGSENMQISLVMESVTPAAQTSTLQEYDYVSDPDEDGEPVKMASQGRLSKSKCCKYTYTKECRGRIRETRKALGTSSIIKESSGHQRLCRRSSRSSSELSTSISICTDNINSPKSVNHSDSGSEKRTEAQNDQENVNKNSPPSVGESSTSLALTFMKNTKRYSTDKMVDSFTTSECSSVICKTEETEGTMIKNTVSLARYKTTRVKIEENVDHCGSETEVLGTKKDCFKNVTSHRGTATFTPAETTNRESSHVLKLKKDVDSSKGKSHKSRTNCSESTGGIFEKSNCDASSSEETKKSSSNSFSNEGLTPCSSLMNVCLSPSKIHDSSPQKEEQSPMPYTSDHDQSLIKSPLSFDTTSMFGDLTVGGFENNLYPDIQLAKESFSPSETTAEKKELFEASFSPFLEHRDWNLMVDVTAELPDEISQYKHDSDSNQSEDNFNHVSFSLPEKIMDYNSDLNSSVSADDLEIKRIVTELESQLQMAKLSCPPPLDHEPQKQLSKFSPLILNPESEDEDSSLETQRSVSQSALFSEPGLSWTGPLHMDFKNSTENHSSLHREKTEKKEFLDLSTSKSEEMLEHEMYTENLMKSLEVISDSLSSGFTSPHSSPSQECEASEDHDKPESEHSDHSNDSEKGESRTLETELTKFSVETSTFTPEESATSDTTQSKSSNKTVKIFISQTEKAEDDIKTDLMYVKQMHFNKTSKAENIMCAEEGHKHDGEESVQDFLSTHSQQNEICEINSQQASPKDLSVVKDDQERSDSVQEAMPDITPFYAQSKCEEIQQKIFKESPERFNTVSPELSENRRALQDKNTEDINAGPSVDRSSISKQPLHEISKPSETLNGSEDKGTQYYLKLSSLNYSECNFTSKCLSKDDEQSNIKSSSTDSFILSSCVPSLSSSPPQSAADGPDISLNNSDIRYSVIPASCSNIDEVTPVAQITNLTQNNNGSHHDSPETVDDIDVHHNHLQTDSEEMDNQMIPNEHKVLLRSTVLDKETKTKSINLTSPSVQNEGQCLKVLPKKVGTFQCEICVMSFRSLPGLKRHKAMKHVVKTEEISQVDAALMFEGITDDAAISDTSENHDLDQASSEAHISTSENNNMDISSEMFSSKLEKQDPISDEMLDALKTDTLQVSSPNSSSMEVKVCKEQKHNETAFTRAECDVDVGTSCDINVKHENLCPAAEDSHTLTDLKAFSDDESSFSQLFPENNDRKRKKCARVYGKSNKKQKQLSCLDINSPPAEVITDKCEESEENKTFNNDTKDVCEYETVSVNETNMLELCPNSSVQSSTENTCHSNDESLCEAEDTSRQPTMHQEESQGVVLENTMSSVSQADCNPDVSTTAYCSPSVENLKTTAEVPASLFEPEFEKTSVQPVANTELTDPVTPGKKCVEQKCRKRIEPALNTKDKQYKCKVCFTWFLTLGELDFHKLSHNPSPPPTCYMCVQRKFSSREQLRDHLREKHGKNKAGVWTCGMCLKEISDVWMYNEHLREHATQFARRGHSQSSFLDVPGCFMQENAVRNFLSSIMQHRPSRPAKGDNIKQPSQEEKNSSLSVNGQKTKIKDEFDSTAPQGGGKRSTLTTLEVLPEAETSSKNVEMHPNCKDPSRDCHHCGKQFPKPFKLQRHLVVHSLQKIFLCHKCPVSYQESKELKDHLKNEHEDKDEADTKHTTLYNCELCADVMHVIKKSFICSSCNYTFSKKEQFDRHMEKHLAGGNKIFKFRGVVRPCKPFNLQDTSDVPPSKKMKAAEDSLINFSLDTVPFNLKSTNKQGIIDAGSTETNTSMKTEDVAEDVLKAAHILVQNDSTEPAPSTTELKEEDKNCSVSEDCESGEMNAVDKEALTEICDVKVEGDCATVLLVSENHINENYTSKDTAEKNSPEHFKNATKETETNASGSCTAPVCSQTDVQDLSSVQQSSCETTTESFSIKKNMNKQDVHSPSPNEQLTAGLDKSITAVSSEDNLKQSDPRCVNTTDAVLSQSPHDNIIPNSTTSSDTARQQKISTRQQKNRKDLKTLSTTARENLGVDLRVKKFRTSRCENIDGPVLASVKEDTASNANIYKNKTGSSNVGFQLKRRSEDSFTPEKMEVVHHFSRKTIPGRPQSSFTLNSSVQKSRPKPGVQTNETYSYRTAESQNILLSKLFGQRLTSFKIPLRKGTSESVS